MFVVAFVGATLVVAHQATADAVGGHQPAAEVEEARYGFDYIDDSGR